jgi:Tol biopolymer transport system component
MALRPGTKLGNYLINAPLGAGGMGEVYRATDLSLQREVAVKILLTSFSQDADRLHRFLQEAQATAALNHPNILSVYQIDQADGVPYMVSELLEGQSLRDLLQSGPLPVRKAIDYGAQAARGLAAAHSKGIVHRDLKPENLFITKDGRIKILDFGLAKLLQPEKLVSNEEATLTRQTGAGVVLGTASYMSPEQARGEDVDHRSDIFSLGAVLHEMLSGQKAFRGKSGAETMAAILKEDPAAFEASRKIPPALERILLHCLEKERDQRFQSAQDLVFDLESIANTPAVQPTRTEELKARGRSIWWWALAGGVIAGIAGGIAIGIHFAKSSAPKWHRLTFSKGMIQAARFAPDGRSVVYSASWRGNPFEIFTTRPESPESRSLGLQGSGLLGVSSKGELAVLSHMNTIGVGVSLGTLARVPMDGGSPREISKGTQFADWDAEGTELAIVRDIGGKNVLEFPMGTPIATSAGYIALPRISSDGSRVALFEYFDRAGDGGAVEVVDRSGRKKILSSGWSDLTGLAWSRDGKEVWFTGTRISAATGLYGVTLEGKEREILKAPTELTILDVSKDGRVLLIAQMWHGEIHGRGPNDKEERELSWFDFSLPDGLSNDGKLLLMHEAGEGGGPNGISYLRGMDGSLPTKLAEGYCGGLSPNEEWVVCGLAVQPAPLQLVPTKAGMPRSLPDDHLLHSSAVWTADGNHILFTGVEQGHGQRIYIQAIDGSPAKAISPEGATRIATSRDGKYVATVMSLDRVVIYQLAGGEPKEVSEAKEGEIVIGWTEDNRSVYVNRPGDSPSPIYLIEVATGKRTLWKTIVPGEPSGVNFITPVFITPDGKSYVYGMGRRLSDLYVVEGLK